MQYLGSISASASGKAGALVASHGRAGTQFRANTMRTQPRSPAQQANRNAFAALTSSWKSLSATQQAAWGVLALSVAHHDRLGQAHNPSGFTLYTSCNRNLQLIGVTAPLSNPPTIPSLPAITQLTATAIYLTSPASPAFAGFSLLATLAAATNALATLRASASLSAAKGNVRPSELRTLATLVLQPNRPVQFTADWLTQFGTFPPSGQVTFSLKLTDPASGFSTTPVRATMRYTNAPPLPAGAGPINVYVGTKLLGTATLAEINVGADTVAAP
jgi:hypothetical protein